LKLLPSREKEYPDSAVTGGSAMALVAKAETTREAVRMLTKRVLMVTQFGNFTPRGKRYFKCTMKNLN
jgi:hypothetical protein